MERRFDNSAEKGITDRTLEINFGRQQQHSKVSDDQVLHHVYHRQHSSSSDNSVSVSSPAVLVPHDQASFNLKSSHFHQPPTVPMGQLQQPDVETEATAFGNQQRLSNSDGDYKISSKEMKELEYFFSKLNPMAREFVPPSLTNPVAHGFKPGQYTNYGDMNMNAQENNCRRKKGSDVQRKRRINNRTNQAQRESVIRRTLYVSDIDQQVTEEQLATLFINCGQVVDCRICGDPNSVLRFAFVEFTDEEGARAALSLSGTMLGYYPVKVLPSKTAIAPVNPNYLPRTEDEREMCARTIYCTNIDRKVSQNEVRLFFESFCGEVHRLRLLGDYQHSTRIAFVEFVMAESAIAALNCSGVILGSLPIRVSPSKTPVRPRAPRLVGH